MWLKCRHLVNLRPMLSILSGFAIQKMWVNSVGIVCTTLPKGWFTHTTQRRKHKRKRKHKCKKTYVWKISFFSCLRLCLRRPGSHIHFLALALMLASLRRTCEPALKKHRPITCCLPYRKPDHVILLCFVSHSLCYIINASLARNLS